MDESARDRSTHEPPGQTASWDFAFPLLTNPFVLLDFAKLIFFTYLLIFLLMGTTFLVMGHVEDLPPILLLFAYCMAGFAVLCVLIMLIVFGNRCQTHFEVGPECAFAAMTSAPGLTANRLAVTLGRIAGSAGTTGAGLLAQSQERIWMPWEHVYHVGEHPRHGVIVLSNSWRTVVRLYCTPQDYPHVIELVRRYAAEGAVRREALRAQAGPSPIPRMVLLSVSSLLAGLMVLALPIEAPPQLVFAPLAGALLTIWAVPLTRLLAVMTMGAQVGLIAAVVREGTQVRAWVTEQDLGGHPVPEFLKYTEFGLLDGGERLRLALATAGLLWIAWLAVQSLRGRLHARPGRPGDERRVSS